jgi:glycosyltransferase involved in cell wall biosynthesis
MDSLGSALLVALESETYGRDDVIYTVLVNKDAAAMTRLRNRGARVIHECILGPDVGLWVCDEAKLYPGLEEVAPRTAVDAGRQLDLLKLATADLVLAPSEFTRNAILDLAGASKLVSVVPYGLDLGRFDTRNVQPEPGRVLMVGTVGLRKGSHHFAAASRELKKRGVPTTCVVAGPIPNTVRMQSTFQGPTYLGQVPRFQIGHEFRLADIFVLPTLAESFSLAHLEALAHGIPVITTPNCGSVVRNGVEGFIVPIRDPKSLADRIEEIVTDRNLRDRMSVAARARAAEFSIQKYAERLINAVELIA